MFPDSSYSAVRDGAKKDVKGLFFKLILFFFFFFFLARESAVSEGQREGERRGFKGSTEAGLMFLPKAGLELTQCRAQTHEP